MQIDLEILKQAFDLWGEEKQTDMIMEECNELVGAILKYRRNPCELTRQHVIDEIADVFVVINYGPMIVEPELIQQRIDFKLNRLKGRIEAKDFEMKERVEILKTFKL